MNGKTKSKMEPPGEGRGLDSADPVADFCHNVMNTQVPQKPAVSSEDDPQLAPKQRLHPLIRVVTAKRVASRIF